MPSDAYPGGVDEDLLEQETMIPRVVEVKPMEGYRLWLRFHDGMTGIVDLSSELWGEMFEPLEDAAGAGSGVVPTGRHLRAHARAAGQVAAVHKRRFETGCVGEVAGVVTPVSLAFAICRSAGRVNRYTRANRLNRPTCLPQPRMAFTTNDQSHPILDPLDRNAETLPVVLPGVTIESAIIALGG